MFGFLVIWGIFFLVSLIAIPDGGDSETWAQRALRAAGYSFVFCIVTIFIAKIFGFSGGGDLDIQYRR